MPTYTVDPSTAYSICDEMDSVQKTIQQRLADQASQIQSKLSEWTDDAKDEYDVRKREWEQIAQHMPTALNYARGELQKIIDNYVTTTKQGANAWSNYSAR